MIYFSGEDPEVAEARREAEERRKEKHRRMEEEREEIRQGIRDKVTVIISKQDYFVQSSLPPTRTVFKLKFPQKIAREFCQYLLPKNLYCKQSESAS